MSLDREVEIKIKVDNKTFDTLVERLNSDPHSAPIGEEVQTDEYYSPRHNSFIDKKNPYEWLRISTRGRKRVVNYKHFFPENAEVFDYCDEYNTVIEDPDQLRKIFNALGFKQIAVVEKTRGAYIYAREFEIALDRVKGLGNFVEIEAKTDFDSVEKTKKRVEELARELGLNPRKAENRGYPYLLMEKLGLLQKY